METEEELPVSRDVPTVDEEPVAMEVENSAINGTKTEATKDDGLQYFPKVPEPLDEAPEK